VPSFAPSWVAFVWNSLTEFLTVGGGLWE